MRWEERTDADRERERTARALARQTSISREANGRFWWQYALSGLLVLTAFAVGMLALCGEASGLVAALLLLCTAAVLTN